MVAAQATVRRPEELRRARRGVALTFLVTGVVFGTWSARLPAIRHALELSDGGLGVAFMGLNAGAVVGLQLGGALVPRTGSRAALRLALPAYAAALAGPAVAGDLAVLTAALFVLALANSVVDVAMNAHGVAVERGVGRPVMSGFHAMLSLGMTVGAALGAVAAAGGLGRTSHFLAVTAAAVAVAPLATRLLLPSRADAAGPARPASRRGSEVAGPTGAGGRRGTVGAALLGGWSGRVVALGALGFCLLLAEGSANDWAAVYLRDGVGATPGLAAAGVAAFSAAMTAGRLAGDRVAARLGPVAAFRGGALLAGGGFGVALLVGTPAAGLAGLGLFGAGLSLTFPLAISAAGHLDGSTATAVARVSTLGYLGAFVGPGVIGALAGRFGLPAALAVPAMLVAATALAARAVAPAGRAGARTPPRRGAAAPAEAGRRDAADRRADGRRRDLPAVLTLGRWRRRGSIRGMPAPGSVPVTVVLGEEELLAERAVAEATSTAVARLGPGTTVEEVRGGALPDGFAMGLATASLFGGGRVVLVQEAEALDAQARAAVLALAADPGPATAVVLRAVAPGRQARFFKDVQRHAAVVQVAKLRPSERASWLRAEVRRLGRKADEAAVAALVDTVGQDLRELAGAVAKLHVAVPPPTALTAAHVAEYLAQTADRGIFELTDAVFAADPATALDRLDALLDQGEDAIRLLGFLASQLRTLLRVADHPDLSAGQVAELLGGATRDWQVKRARTQAARFHPEHLRRALDVIAEADFEIRNGSPSQRLLLELVISRIAAAGTPAAAGRGAR